MILVDTSAWVEYDRATGSTVDERLATLIAEDQGLVAVTEPVVMEVLAGAKDDRRERDLRRFLERFDLLAFDATSDFDAGVNIYRSCRNAGVTPRGLLDCMIAAVAIRHDAAVLSSDHDLSRIATIMSLRLDSASTPAD